MPHDLMHAETALQVIAEQQRKHFAQAELAHRTLTMPKVLAEDKGHMRLALHADSEAQAVSLEPSQQLKPHNCILQTSVLLGRLI